MTTSAAANVAGHLDKDKEKVEKRRALGRGLESLLPGPRVVGGVAAASHTPAPHTPAQHGIEIRAVVEETVASELNSELRSEGRTNASVPTQPLTPYTNPRFCYAGFCGPADHADGAGGGAGAGESGGQFGDSGYR